MIYYAVIAAAQEVTGLNPCCNGIYLMINIVALEIPNALQVLILVVMEYT